METAALGRGSFVPFSNARPRNTPFCCATPTNWHKIKARVSRALEYRIEYMV